MPPPHFGTIRKISLRSHKALTRVPRRNTGQTTHKLTFAPLFTPHGEPSLFRYYVAIETGPVADSQVTVARH